MKRANSILFIILTGLLCGLVGADGPPTSAPTQTFETYVNVAGGYSIKHPATWKGGGSPEMTLFASTQEVGTEHLRPYFTVKVFQVQPDVTIDKVAKEMNQLFDTMVPKTTFIEKSAIDLSGHHGFKFVVQNRTQNRLTRTTLGVVIIDAKQYIISYRTSPDAYAASEPDIMAVFESFRIIEKPS